MREMFLLYGAPGQWERLQKEIATERAVGMTLFQTFKVFLIETLWLIFFSIIIFIAFFPLLMAFYRLALYNKWA